MFSRVPVFKKTRLSFLSDLTLDDLGGGRTTKNSGTSGNSFLRAAGLGGSGLGGEDVSSRRAGELKGLAVGVVPSEPLAAPCAWTCWPSCPAALCRFRLATTALVILPPLFGDRAGDDLAVELIGKGPSSLLSYAGGGLPGLNLTLLSFRQILDYFCFMFAARDRQPRTLASGVQGLPPIIRCPVYSFCAAENPREMA